MARLSKAQPFEVYDDSRTSTTTTYTAPALPRSSGIGMSPRSKPRLPRPELDRQDSKYESFPAAPTYPAADDEDPNFLTVDEDDERGDDDNTDADAEDEDRRQSALTSASISTMPESIAHTDQELPFTAHRPYTPPSARPTFRRAESVRRMQMTSPTPFDRSPRRSVLTRSRPGTPRSVRSVKSPKARRRIEEEDEDEEQREEAIRRRAAAAAAADDEDDQRDFPLVLLHLTILPVELPWSAASMEAVLPRAAHDGLQLLRAKVSETILQRGILIPHPREDYELLEERLLEALELRAERVTKCGHFRPAARGSVSTVSSSGDGSVDSGLGSSVGEGPDGDGDACDVCRHRVKTSASGVGAAGQRWMVKVFAANGLMRAPAWAAAWPEMERVDVEIVPWIGDEFRKALDARAAEEEAEERRRAEEDRGFVQTAGELMWIPDGEVMEAPRAEEQHVLHGLEGSFGAEVLARIVTASGQYSVSPISEPGNEQDGPVKAPSDLPPIYRPSEIPLSLLLRNYVFLLAQDARNVAIFALTVIALWLSVQSVFTSASATAISPTLEICPHAENSKPAFEATMELLSPPGGVMKNMSPVETTPADGPESQQPMVPVDEAHGASEPVLKDESSDFGRVSG